MNSAWSAMTPKTSLPAASGKNQNILAPVSLVCGLLAWTLLPILAALAAKHAYTAFQLGYPATDAALFE